MHSVTRNERTNKLTKCYINADTPPTPSYGQARSQGGGDLWDLDPLSPKILVFHQKFRLLS